MGGAGVVMVAMMTRGAKGRRRDEHQQQSSEEELLHELRVAPGEIGWKVDLCGEGGARDQEGKAGARG